MAQGGIPDFKFVSSPVLAERGPCMEFYLKSGRDGGGAGWRYVCSLSAATHSSPACATQAKSDSVVTFLNTPLILRDYLKGAYLIDLVSCMTMLPRTIGMSIRKTAQKPVIYDGGVAIHKHPSIR